MNSGKVFQRRTEDFHCEQCGAHVMGDGYTNHCPKCLYSKHVDIFPGDRLAKCGGLMEPVGLERDGAAYKVLQRCIRCGHTRKNKNAREDDFDALLAISRKSAV